MHVPDKWKITDPKQIADIVDKFGFATLISPSLEASHVPLIYQAENQFLFGHLARNNQHAKEASGSKVVAVFSGPHYYIAPNWYANSPAVPTWNYVAVHMHGTIEWLDDSNTLSAVEKLVAKYQPALLDNQAIMPIEFQQKLAKGIVGFRVHIERIEAKAKLGQHRKSEDQAGVVKGLIQEKNAEAAQLLAVMDLLQLGLGKEK
ncbi:FMN-binding negative transcriptional regulator [Thalassotalea sp. M1531]|uniref:FMN-binding negative transcriptional regulator n=1 Tax=Thalassotalea algicola TaxID=2716224 RepID=A0A7Y0LDW3_9GAMM|nr:FMN-binding negative transcriptional regulator [Thalassotalea algicola]NMP31846.1 FMN-binding negative transcriptional regulator [Thalassotalea algicola]